MRKHLLAYLGVAVDGLIAALFGVEAFAAATAVLGAACVWSYREELKQGWRQLRGAERQASAAQIHCLHVVRPAAARSVIA